MNELIRTGIFVGVAAICVGLAVTTQWMSQPKPPAEFANVGSEFYPDFQYPADAKNLQVIAYDEDTASAERFNVEYKNGLWRIPSHHDYPADGGEMLAKTASSVIGIRREELRSRSEADHEELGVIDPLDDRATALKGRGHRLTFRKEDGSTLADYIIGKEVKDRPGYYFVRLPDDKSTFVAKVNIDLSTKFADWINKDLLEVPRDELTKVVINKYSIDQTQGKIVDRQLSELTRAKGTDPWTLEGLDEKTETLNTTAVNALVGSIDDLEIVGVRPKPAGLSRDLKVAKGIKLDTGTLLDLQSKGFFITPEGSLLSDKGEMYAGTDKGIMYVLRFGEIFTGTELEIETGLGGTDEDASTEEQPADAAEGGDATKSGDKKSGLKPNRYLFVTAEFDPSLMDAAPVEPTKPTPPSGIDPPVSEAASDSADEAVADASSDTDKADSKAATNGTETPTEDAEPQSANSESSEDTAADDKTEDTLDDAATEEYEAALRKYENMMRLYEGEKKSYEKNVDGGKKRVEELNNRFADWYYVISDEGFEKLSQGRASLVTPKESPKATDEDDTATETDGTDAAADGPALGGRAAATEEETPAVETGSDTETDQAPQEAAGTTDVGTDDQNAASPNAEP